MSTKTRPRFFLLILLAFFLVATSYSQNIPEKEKDLIQFSGIIVTSDSLKPVPYVNILIKNSFRGTTSDFFGYFSFVAEEGDTLMFSSIGFKPSRFIVPDSLSTNRYSLIQIMLIDTILLPATFIYPWPTKEQFRQAFLNLEIPDDDMERAKKNLALLEMHERFKVQGMDASMNYKNYMQEQTSKLYYAGQYPPNNLLNPIAWAKFIKAWQNGELNLGK